MLEAIENATTVAQLAKVLTLDQLKAAAKAYVQGKAYRKARNERIARLVKLAVDAGLDR